METYLRAVERHLSYGITHRYLPPNTGEQAKLWTHPALTPVRQAGTRFTYPGGMEG